MSMFPELDALVEAPGDPADPVKPPSAGQRLTLRQKADIGRGIHPLGGRLSGIENQRCGNCLHRRADAFHRWPKCVESGHAQTRGAATDCRAWWPGCNKWEAKS